MKKLWPVILLLALALTLGLAACRQQDEPEAEAEPAAEAVAEDKEEEAKEDEQQPEILPPELVGSWRLEGDPAASLEVQVAPEVQEVSLAAVAVDNKLDHLPLHHRISHPNNHSSKHSRLIQVEFEAVYSDSPIFG